MRTTIARTVNCGTERATCITRDENAARVESPHGCVAFLIGMWPSPNRLSEVL